MLETRGTVVACDGDDALVRAEAGGGCGHCATGTCATGLLSRMFTLRRLPIRVANDAGARPGDAVVLALPHGSVARAAVTAYLLPLATTLAGAVAGSALSEPEAGDLAAACGAAVGLAGGWIAARRIAGEGATGRGGARIVRTLAGASARDSE